MWRSLIYWIWLKKPLAWPFWKHAMNRLGVKGQSTDLKFSHMLKYDVAMPHTNFGKKIFTVV